MRYTRSLIPFICTLLLQYQTAFSQSGSSMPDINFWNTSYGYKFHIGKGTLPPIKHQYDGGYNISDYKHCARDISGCYEGSPGTSILRSPIDTNIMSLIEKTNTLFKGNLCYITRDYDDNKNADYSELLNDLYNAWVGRNTNANTKFLDQARIHYNRIPDSSPIKPVAYIQMRWTEQEVNDQTQIASYDFLSSVDSGANEIASKIRMGDMGWLTYDECLEDLWGNYGRIKICNDYYTYALDFASNIPDELTRYLRIQRIRERMLNSFIYDASTDFTFRSFKANVLSDLKNDNGIKEFGLHNWIEQANLYDRPTNMVTVADDSILYYLRTALNSGGEYFLKEDVAELLSGFQMIALANGHLETSRQASIVLLNYIIENKLARLKNGESMLQKLYYLYIQMGQYGNAEVVNSRLLYKSRKNGSFLHLKYFLLAEGLYLQEKDTSKAKSALDSVASYLNINPDGSILRDYYLAKRGIAAIENNLRDYQYYDSQYKSYVDDRIQEFGEGVAFATNHDRDIRDEIIKEKSDSLISAKEKNYSLLKKMSSDSLRHANEEADRKVKDQKASDRRQLYLGAGAVLVVLIIYLIILFFTRRRREAERIILELASLKAGYFGHGIGGSFQRIVDLLDTNGESNVSIAKDLTKEMSVLYTDLEEGVGKPTTLIDEIMRNERYVSVVSIGQGNRVDCIHDLDGAWAESISVPRFFLLDIYANALKHGRLAEKVDGRIIAKLNPCLGDARTFILRIENNGMGREESDLYKERDHVSTGMARVAKMLRLFDFRKKGAKVQLINLEGPKDMLGEDGLSKGTFITFKIVRQ